MYYSSKTNSYRDVFRNGKRAGINTNCNHPQYIMEQTRRRIVDGSVKPESSESGRRTRIANEVNDLMCCGSIVRIKAYYISL